MRLAFTCQAQAVTIERKQIAPLLTKMPSKNIQLPTPVPNALTMDDPRKPGEQVGVVAFYYPDIKTPWDVKCESSVLGNFYPLPLEERIHMFGNYFNNAEAAFQSLKHPDKVQEFVVASGSQAYELKQTYKKSADLTYSGLGSNWKAMLHVLKLKFQPGTSLAQVLEQTGDAFLVEHTPTTGWDSLWADNHIGDGTNWLGLQLMMVRAMLKGADDTDSWIQYAHSYLDLDTGKCLDGASGENWQQTVKEAAKAVNMQFGPDCSQCSSTG